MKSFCDYCPEKRSYDCELPTLGDRLAIVGHIAMRAAAGLGMYAGHIAHADESVVSQIKAAQALRISTCIDEHISTEIEVFIRQFE